MSKENLRKKVDMLLSDRNYSGIVNLLKKIQDEQLRLQTCYVTLVCLGMERAIEEYGRVTVLEDKEKYERAKIGLEDLPPHAVLYRHPDDTLEGEDEMLDFVSEDNPLKQYFREINKN